MGEAKRRKAAEADLVWHHTSILRTNRIWMSGVIELEGRSPGVLHPLFGEVLTDATRRRPMRDFPPVAWFTSSLNVPRCLQEFAVLYKDKNTGEITHKDFSGAEISAFTMNRMALGFPAAAIGAIPWPEHFGYHTAEGRDLNESARDVGDNPDEWWITEEPVDVLKATAFRGSPSAVGIKLERRDDYLGQVRRMVGLCRAMPNTVIPPSWVGSREHRALAERNMIHPDCRQFNAFI